MAVRDLGAGVAAIAAINSGRRRGRGGDLLGRGAVCRASP
jgi:hypothetical protein